MARRGTVFRVQYQKAILYMPVYTLTRCIPEVLLFHPKYGNIPFSFVFVFFPILIFSVSYHAQHRLEYRKVKYIGD